MLNHVLLFMIMATVGLSISLSALSYQNAMGQANFFGSQNIQTDLQSVESSSVNITSSSASNSLIICPLTPPFICDGTNEDDIIIGTPVGDTINGLDGNDKIQGNNFADLVFGGPGNDVISGGEGTDTLFGEGGNDIVQADSGTNIVFGGGGAAIYGGKGDDTLLGGSDNDILTGGPGHDYFDCNEGWDTVTDFDSNDDTVNSNCEKLVKK